MLFSMRGRYSLAPGLNHFRSRTTLVVYIFLKPLSISLGSTRPRHYRVEAESTGSTKTHGHEFLTED